MNFGYIEEYDDEFLESINPKSNPTIVFFASPKESTGNNVIEYYGDLENY